MLDEVREEARQGVRAVREVDGAAFEGSAAADQFRLDDHGEPRKGDGRVRFSLFTLPHEIKYVNSIIRGHTSPAAHGLLWQADHRRSDEFRMTNGADRFKQL
ncbi:hypothetical protein GCM10008959_22350 [Deinococcus seoulensis]|uniref:Uncharacterized protein n=1 Tax=Deinococcus seoulensis TaxID=1837379 RepID=A0ABQ2RTI5_9DEIO|nr:hypothetical protein GCM10008959_22350 [Deinococcus seoulensis]